MRVKGEKPSSHSSIVSRKDAGTFMQVRMEVRKISMRIMKRDTRQDEQKQRSQGKARRELIEDVISIR